MYVCVCKNITEKQVRQAICEGACSMKCLVNRLEVASQCGKCGIIVKQILRESQSEQQQQ